MSDYARGRADAAKAIRHAAESVIPGAEVPWLKPGARVTARQIREWLYDWVADIAEHGPTTDATQENQT